MIRFLQTGWFAMLIGALLYLGVTAVLIGHAPAVKAERTAMGAEAALQISGPSCSLATPELDRPTENVGKQAVKNTPDN